MIEKDDLKKLIDVAAGRKKADLVLKNGNIVDLCGGKILKPIWQLQTDL